MTLPMYLQTVRLRGLRKCLRTRQGTVQPTPPCVVGWAQAADRRPEHMARRHALLSGKGKTLTTRG